jgi:hypothetical protein
MAPSPAAVFAGSPLQLLTGGQIELGDLAVLVLVQCNTESEREIVELLMKADQVQFSVT